MIVTRLLLYLYLLLYSILELKCDHKISKRSLFFPITTVVQFTYGLSVPITIDGAEGGTTILLSTCLQGNYDLPKKSSDLQVHQLMKRNLQTDLSKIEFYKNIMEYLESLDLNGEHCLLRLICEIAKYPLDVEDQKNVVEQIAHFIFTPSLLTDMEQYDSEGDSSFYSSLLRAEETGKSKQHCKTVYYSCEVSLATLFTKFFII